MSNAERTSSIRVAAFGAVLALCSSIAAVAYFLESQSGPMLFGCLAAFAAGLALPAMATKLSANDHQVADVLYAPTALLAVEACSCPASLATLVSDTAIGPAAVVSAILQGVVFSALMTAWGFRLRCVSGRIRYNLLLNGGALIFAATVAYVLSEIDARLLLPSSICFGVLSSVLLFGKVVFPWVFDESRKQDTSLLVRASSLRAWSAGAALSVGVLALQEQGRLGGVVWAILLGGVLAIVFDLAQRGVPSVDRAELKAFLIGEIALAVSLAIESAAFFGLCAFVAAAVVHLASYSCAIVLKAYAYALDPRAHIARGVGRYAIGLLFGMFVYYAAGYLFGPDSAPGVCLAILFVVFALNCLLEFSLREMWDLLERATGSDAEGEESTGHGRPDDDLFDAACQALASAYRLTPREGDVLALLARGRNAERIASALSISQNTVRAYSARIYSKMGVVNQQGLIAAVETFLSRS